jgi:ubiquinone/menaquinone biosynthesis C-methylase UbiE
MEFITEPLEKLVIKLIDPVTEQKKRFLKKLGLTNIKGQKVLDIGCGDGGDALIFANMEADVIGVDITPHPNWHQLERHNLAFKIADACNLPFSSETFDIVFEKDMLHHIKNPQKALAEIKRVTKKGGQIIIIEANRYNLILYFHMTLMKRHQHFSRSYFKNLVRDYFGNIKLMTIESHVYPVKYYGIVKVIHSIENFLEKIPMVSNFLSYNITIVEKLMY